MSNDPPRDLSEPNGARASLTRRHWLYAVSARVEVGAPRMGVTS
jgi:hypothetical protein